MKRITGIFFVLIALLAGFIIALPLFVSSDAVRTKILTQLEELTGREVSFQGNPSVALNPFLGIEISNLVVEDPNSPDGRLPLLSVETVQAQLDLLPALTGNVSLSEYRLLRPQLNLTVYGDGNANWNFDKGDVKQAINQADNDQAQITTISQLGIFTIEDGKIHYDDEISGRTEDLTSINANLDWQNTNTPTLLAGTAIWRGENITVNSTIENLIKLAAGKNTNATIAFNSAPLSLDFTGEANMISDLFLKGQTSISSPSLIRMAEFLRIEFGDLGASGAWSIRGQIEGTSKSATIKEATTVIAGYEAQGAINLSIDELEQTKIDGTLAFDQIDLTPQFAETETASEVMPNTAEVDDIELDVRISANSIKAGSLQLQNVAAAIAANNQNWIFDIGYSEGFGGTIISKIGERVENEKQQTFLEISARDIDTATLSGFLEERLLTVTGKANIDANLRTNTLRVENLLDDLNGTLDVKLSNGAIEGIDLQSMLKKDEDLEGQNAQTKLDLNGSTSFNEFSITSFLNKGVASIAQSKMSTETINVQLIGSVNFGDNGIAITAQEMKESAPIGDRLFIGGTLRNPLISRRQSTKPSNDNTDQQEDSQTLENDVSN